MKEFNLPAREWVREKNTIEGIVIVKDEIVIAERNKWSKIKKTSIDLKK